MIQSFFYGIIFKTTLVLGSREINEEEEGEEPGEDDQLGEPVFPHNLGGIAALLVDHGQLDIS